MKKKLLIIGGIVLFLVVAVFVFGIVLSVTENDPNGLFYFRRMEDGYSVEINENYDGEPVTEIEFPSTHRNQPVIAIGYSNFSWKSSVTSVTIPNSVVTLLDQTGNQTSKYSAFSEYTSLTTVNFADNSKLKTIDSYAFYGCKALVSIDIPNSVTSIEDGAFENCTSLTDISIPDSVTSVGSNVFKGCDLLEYTENNNILYLGNSVNPYVVLMGVKDKAITLCLIKEGTKVVASSALAGCKQITNVTLPDSLVSIDYCAFGWCAKISAITIPKSVTKIDKGAFDGCESLKTIVYEGTTSEWEAIKKGLGWNGHTPSYTILCTNGSISKNGTVTPYQ